MNLKVFISIAFLFSNLFSDDYAFLDDNPEIYQDVLIHNQVVRKGVRSCEDRYEAILPILRSLPKNFKSLDIGASQGYFSFKMAEEFDARCVMIEGGYVTTDYKWNTGSILHFLMNENTHLADVSLLQSKVCDHTLKQLGQLEEFDVVLALSVIHHMRKNPNEGFSEYDRVIDAVLDLAPIVIIENPINTGEHTRYIRKYLQSKAGDVIFTSKRGGLIYEIFYFKKTGSSSTVSIVPDVSVETLKAYNGVRNVR